QDTITVGGLDGYQWHINSFGMTGTVVSNGSLVTATTQNTVPSSVRDDGISVNDFLSSVASVWGIFVTANPGQNLLVDFGVPVSVSEVTVRNAVGESWAPTQYSIQYSNDNVNWTTAKTVSNVNTGTSLQTITVNN
ncbi:MAG: discoidin domain-containing protein, partial [Candidatus Nanopelagicus sp.]